MKSVYGLLVVISICALALSPVEGRLSITGAIFNAELAPGDHISHNINVSLSSDEPAPVNLAADLMDWYQYPSGLSLGIKDNPDIAPYSSRKFLTVSPENFSLKPGSYQNVKIEGIMPKGDGSRYAIVFVHIVPNATKKSGGVAVSFGMNTLALLTISGSNIAKTGEISSLGLDEPISPRQQNVTMIFKNTGNTHYRIKANVTLKDENGDVLATASPDSSEAVIPTAVRKTSFSMMPKEELKPGSYTIAANAALSDGTVIATNETKFEIKAK